MQFLISSVQKVGDRATLGNEEARHLSVVLRKKVGDEIRLTDGEGSLFQGVIESLSKKSAVVLIKEKLSAPQSFGRLILASALLKGDKIEFVLQKAAELGVSSFRPFVSSRTIPKIDPKKDKTARWQKIAQEASKQCGRAVHMIVEAPVTFEALVNRTEAEVKIIFWEESKESLRRFFSGADLKKSSQPSVVVLIGPEGGFSREEINLAVRHGFAVMSLGSFVLKADTAAIAAMSLIQYELGNV